MLQLFKIFWDICRLRAAPQDLPVGRSLLIVVVVLGVIIDSFSSAILMPKMSFLEVFSTVVIYNVLLLLSVYLVLKIVGYADRGTQTLTAIAGSGVFISLILLPVLLTLNASSAEVKSFGFLILIDNIWRINVNAHIFKHALSISLLMSMIISISYLLFGVLVAEFLLSALTA